MDFVGLAFPHLLLGDRLAGFIQAKGFVEAETPVEQSLRIDGALALAGGVAALVGSLIVGVTMFSSVVDRTRDFGTLLAIGASRRDLLSLLVAQAMVFFALGSTVGLAVFGIVKHYASSAPMLAPPWMLALVAVGSLLSCLLASVAAIRRVLSIDPAIVFKG